MREAQTFSCPTCGAPFDEPQGAETVRCPYCHNVVIVPELISDNLHASSFAYAQPMSIFTSAAALDLGEIKGLLLRFGEEGIGAGQFSDPRTVTAGYGSRQIQSFKSKARRSHSIGARRAWIRSQQVVVRSCRLVFRPITDRIRKLAHGLIAGPRV